MILYGPFPVRTRDANGELTEELASGVHYTAERSVFEANVEVLTPYLAVVDNPLQFVMGSDSPENGYENTFPIRFPNQATADTVIGDA